MKTEILILSGSLAQKGLLRILKSELAKKAIVVEFDTQINRSLLPYAGTMQWLSLPDLVCRAEAAGIDRQAHDILANFLGEHPEAGDRSGDSALRKACFRWLDGQIILSYLLNHHVAKGLLSLHDIGTVIVGPGTGVNLTCWREVAARENLTFRELPVEIKGPTLGRRIQKRFASKSRKPAPHPVSVAGSEPEGPTRDFKLLCISKRLCGMLRNSNPSPLFQLHEATLADLGTPDAEDLRREIKYFRNWHQRFKSSITKQFPDAPGCCSDAISRMAGFYISEAYPRFSVFKELAVAYLRKCKPTMILCDTQTGALERVWDLAAKDLGIPIIAFTYDHLVDSATTLVPDYLISDSARNTWFAVARGLPASRVFESASFRRPTETSQPLETRRFPVVLFADNYFTLLSSGLDPRANLGHYRLIAASAKLFPEVRFVIKFHPLRSKKTELHGFIGMDETELRIRIQFIKSLDPPSNLRLALPEESMQSLLQTADILLNTISFTAFEAFQLGVPVVFLEEPDSSGVIFTRIHDFLDPLTAFSSDELNNKIRQLLSDPVTRGELLEGQRLYLDSYYWSSSGSLATAIENIMKYHDHDGCVIP